MLEVRRRAMRILCELLVILELFRGHQGPLALGTGTFVFASSPSLYASTLREIMFTHIHYV